MARPSFVYVLGLVIGLAASLLIVNHGMRSAESAIGSNAVFISAVGK